MTWHLHRWGKWEDVAAKETLSPTIYGLATLTRNVIVQRRRCAVCNLVKERRP